MFVLSFGAAPNLPPVREVWGLTAIARCTPE